MLLSFSADALSIFQKIMESCPNLYRIEIHQDHTDCECPNTYTVSFIRNLLNDLTPRKINKLVLGGLE
jgi:hypothetical protein